MSTNNGHRLSQHKTAVKNGGYLFDFVIYERSSLISENKKFYTAGVSSLLTRISAAVGFDISFFTSSVFLDFLWTGIFLPVIIPCETNKLWIVADDWAPLEIQYKIRSLFKETCFVLRLIFPKSSKYFRFAAAVFWVTTTLKVVVCFFPTFCRRIINIIMGE